MAEQFYAKQDATTGDGAVFMRYGVEGDELVATCPPTIEGAAEQIARALNRLPQAEALLIKAAHAIRNIKSPTQDDIHPLGVADEIEEWMVNG